MVPRSSAPKIRHSLWHRLLRLRQRRHAHRTQVQLRRRTNARTGRPARRQRKRTISPAAPAIPIPFYVHGVRLLIVVLGISAIAGTTLSILQSLPHPPQQQMPAQPRSPAGKLPLRSSR